MVGLVGSDPVQWQRLLSDALLQTVPESTEEGRMSRLMTASQVAEQFGLPTPNMLGGKHGA
jgi:hypothetical protein